jgi:hypothetical protein
MRSNYDLTLGRWRWLWVDFPSKEAPVPIAKEAAAKKGMAEISGFALDFKQAVGFGAALHGEIGWNHEHGLAQ